MSDNKPIITADGQTVVFGAKVFDYYDGHWGTVGMISDDGWFDHHRENGEGKGYLDGSRVCVRIPRRNPFFESHGSGNPPLDG